MADTEYMIERVRNVEVTLRDLAKSLHALRLAIQRAQSRGEEPSPFLIARVENALSDVRLQEERGQFGGLDDLDLPDIEELLWDRAPRNYGATRKDGQEFQIMVFLSGGPNLKEFGANVDTYLNDLLASYDGGIISVQSGWGSFFARATAKATAEAIEKVGDAVKAAVANLPQAQANSENADALSKLLTAVNEAEQAVMVYGPVMVLKVEVQGRPRVITTDLTKEQQRELKRHPNWLLEPALILDRLAAVESTTRDQLPPPPPTPALPSGER